MFVFTEPTSSGRSGAAPRPGTAPRACTSIGSPSEVPGAVGLDVVDVSRARARVRERCADHRLLRRAVRRREPAAAPVLVDGGAADHRQDAVAVGERVGQALQHHDPAALAADVPVGGGVERLAPPVRRQHPCAGRSSMWTSGSSIRFTPPARAMRDSPARRLWQARWTATSEDEQAVSTARLGPCKPEQVGQAARRHAVVDARARCRRRCAAAFANWRAEVVAVAEADEDAGRGCP